MLIFLSMKFNSPPFRLEEGFLVYIHSFTNAVNLCFSASVLLSHERPVGMEHNRHTKSASEERHH